MPKNLCSIGGGALCNNYLCIYYIRVDFIPRRFRFLWEGGCLCVPDIFDFFFFFLSKHLIFFLLWEMLYVIVTQNKKCFNRVWFKNFVHFTSHWRSQCPRFPTPPFFFFLWCPKFPTHHYKIGWIYHVNWFWAHWCNPSTYRFAELVFLFHIPITVINLVNDGQYWAVWLVSLA